MNKFVKRLKLLMKDYRYTNLDLANKLSIPVGRIKSWKSSQSIPKLDIAVKLANELNCSLDYLFGKVEIDEFTKFKNTPTFKHQLHKYMTERDVTQYKLIKDKICHADSFTRWFKEDCVPNMSNVIKLADYFNLSIDEFVGRL